MFAWLKNILPSSKKSTYGWNDLTTGDYVRVSLKDPKKVGIVSDTETLTFQRLDSQDIQRGYVEGFILRTEQIGIKPANVETLEINVVKKSAHSQRLISYLLLREEIEQLELIDEDNRHE